MAAPLQLAISTCPNDTFAFHGLLADRVDRRGMTFEIQLHDVQELNEALAAGRFDVAKTSMYAALRMSRSMVLLESGAALGYGVGPLLLAAEAGREPRPVPPVEGERPDRVLCPGADTTASLLYRLCYPSAGSVEQVLFSEIMPALRNGSADFGVCIHEGRFTWQTQGLWMVADLGQRWESETGQPLPLGGIVGRRSLGDETLATVSAIIRDSIAYGLAHRQETLPTMRRYAQEFDDDVLFAHVDLYVNRWTVSLGTTGREAIEALRRRAQHAGALDADQPALRMVGPIGD